MASFFDFPPEVRQMIYNCLVETSCKDGRIFSSFWPGSLWSSKPCKDHAEGVCVLDRGLKSILHHAPVGALLSLMKTNSSIYREAEATLVTGADLTIRASFPEDDSLCGKSFVTIIEQSLAPLATETREQIRSLRLDQTEWRTPIMRFGIPDAASCAFLMTQLSRLCPSLERVYLLVDVAMADDTDEWELYVREWTLAAVEGLVAGSTKNQLWFRCASFFSPDCWHYADEEDYESQSGARQTIENRVTEIRNTYTATRKKQSDRLVDRASHYNACFDGSYLLATKSLRALTIEDSE